MEFRYWLIGWSKEKILWAVGLALATGLAVFASVNMGVGPTKEISGVVTSVGLDASTRYELPAPIVSVKLQNGEEVNIAGLRGLNISKGDSVVLSERARLLSPGIEYKFVRLEK